MSNCIGTTIALLTPVFLIGVLGLAVFARRRYRLTLLETLLVVLGVQRGRTGPLLGVLTLGFLAALLGWAVMDIQSCRAGPG